MSQNIPKDPYANERAAFHSGKKEDIKAEDKAAKDIDAMMRGYGFSRFTPPEAKDFFTTEKVEQIANDIFKRVKPTKAEQVDYDFVVDYINTFVAKHMSKVPLAKDGKTPTQSELTAIIKPLIPKPKSGEKIDYQRITVLVKKIIDSLPKKEYVIDRKQIEQLIAEKVGGLKTHQRQFIGSVASLSQLTDVILDGVPQDDKGNYVLGGVSGASDFLSLTDTFSSYAGKGTEVVRVNAAEDALETVALAGGGDALTADPLSQFATTTKAQLNSVISDGVPMYVGDAPTSHTHTASEVTDFDTEVSNNANVVANTAKISYTDAAKVAGIETGATADQTDAEIKTGYENNANTNGYTDAEKSKLAGLESSRFLGTFASVGALETAYPAVSAVAGSYADVDGGVGQDIERYILDDDDDAWKPSGGTSTAETAASIKTKYESNPDTNVFLDAEKTKLGGIEASATADQTGAQIKVAYEGELDTNAYTDAEKTKVSGVEASADVTDTLNVTASGAVMDSEVTNLAEVKAFAGADYATAAQGVTADSAVQPASTDTLTNKNLAQRSNTFRTSATVASSATPTPTAGTLWNYFTVTALAVNATFGTPTGTINDGDMLYIRVKDNATSRTLAFGAIYVSGTSVTLPTATTISTNMRMLFIYDSVLVKWVLQAID